MAVVRGPLLERAYERGQLEMLVSRAREGTGSVALIEGVAGIGKTSVLDVAREMALDAGLTVLSSRAGLLEGELPWNVVRQLFSKAIGADERRRAELLAGASSLARPALGLADGDPAASESAALHGLYWLTEALAAEQPLLAAVDDAHWADPSSLQYLAYVGQRIADLPLLLVVTLRPDERQDAHIQALRLQGAGNRIVLRELSPAGTTTLTRRALGEGAAEEFCAACHRATGGNPFMLRELLLELDADGWEPSVDAAAEVARITPESVKRSVLLRLSQLPVPAQALVTAVALLGTQSQLSDAARVAGLSSADAASAADALAAAGIFSSGSPLGFVHPLVREVIYTDVPAHERAQRHGETARKLSEMGADVRRIAAQLERAEPAADQWVVQQLRDAARESFAEGAAQPAVGWLRRAVEEPPAPELHATVLRELAMAEARTGSEAAISYLEQAIGVARDAATRLQAAVELVLLRFLYGHMEGALELARELIDRRAIDDPVLRMRVIAAAVTGAVLVPALRDQAPYFLDRLPAELDDDSPAGRLAHSARLADAQTRRAPMAEIADLAERALGGGMLLQELAVHELLYWNAASSLVVAERFKAAGSAIDAALEDSRRRGSIVGFALCSCFRCLLHWRSGDITAGVADGWQAWAAVPDELPQVRAYTAAFLSGCLVERGELNEARELVTGPAFRGDLPGLLGYHLMRISRGHALIVAGDVEEGVEELLALGAAMRELEFGPGICPWRSRAALGLAMLGRKSDARALAEQELAMARETESGWGQVAALQALASATPERSVELLEEAHSVSEQHGLALERARCLVLLGAHHRRHRQRRVAAELLERGLEAAAACGALALCERARGELVAIGLSPRRRALSGAEALTPAERRVAELAVEGRSNRDIAQALFVSLRTVETHLTHCYQKLGIESRGQLAEALAERASGAA
jgi:DNA-binding CsgD family transcriptional regulator